MERSLIQLSQSHFSLLSLCPRKYQYTYLDQFFIPTVVSQKTEQEILGQQFHLIMQQYWMGLDVVPLLEASPLLKRRFETFQAYPPAIISGDRFTEHRRMLKIGSYLLVGVFDLLVMSPGAGQIIDWKSYQKPKSSYHLQQSWQTKLYLYLLAETSALRPDQIAMTYWFAQTQAPQDSHTYSFPYSQALHQETHDAIIRRLEQLDQWRQALDAGQPFPQVDLSQGHCFSEQHQCPYLSHCQRSPNQMQAAAILDLSAMPEVRL